MNDEEDDNSTFLSMCEYFYETKGDPTRYVDWNEERFKALRPNAHRTWVNLSVAELVCDSAWEDLHEEYIRAVHRGEK